MGSHPGRVHRRGPGQDRRLALRGRGAKLGCSLFGQSLRPVSVSMRPTLLSPSQSFLEGSRCFPQQTQHTQVRGSGHCSTALSATEHKGSARTSENPLPRTQVNTARTRRAQPTDVPHDDLEEAKIRRQKGVEGTMPFQTHQRNGAGGCWERTETRTRPRTGRSGCCLQTTTPCSGKALQGYWPPTGAWRSSPRSQTTGRPCAWHTSSPRTLSSCRCSCPSRGPRRPSGRCAPSPTPQGGNRHHVREPALREGAHRGGVERLRAENLLLGAPGGGRQGGGARPRQRERRGGDAPLDA